MPALYPPLYARGFWLHLCDEEATATCLGIDEKCCEAQLVRVGFTSSVTFFLADAAAGFWGEYVDRVGAHRCFALASAISVVGYVLLALSLWPRPMVSFARDALATLAFATLGLAGAGVFNGAYVGVLAICGTSASHISAFTCFSAACFDGSALVFVLLSLCGVSLGVGLVRTTLLWVVVAIGLCTAFLMLLARWVERRPSSGAAGPPGAPPPGTPGADAPMPQAAERSALLPASTPPAALPMPPDPDDAFEVHKGGGGGGGGLLPSGSMALQSVCSARLVATLCHRQNLAVLAFMVALNLVGAFYLQTQAEQMSLIFSPSSADTLSTFFESSFPVFGFAAAVAAARLVFEKHHDDELACWTWPVALGGAFTLVQMVPVLPFQYLAALIFGPMRTLQWGCYFHALAVAPRYPQDLAGRLLGYNNVVIALLSDTLPYFLTALAAGDNTTTKSEAAWRYATVRIGLLVPVLATGALLAHEMRRGRG